MTRAPVIAVLEPGYASYGPETAIAERHGATLHVLRPGDPVEGLADLDVRAVLVRQREVGAAVFDACSDLALIVRYGVGVDNVDLERATARRIYVANVPDYGAENEVSDHAVALYLAVARRIVTRDAEMRRGLFDIGQDQPVPGHRGGTLGLVGCGRIGRRAARIFKALGFAEVLVSDPAVSRAEADELGVHLTDVDDLCARADAISLHTPLLPGTRHIIDAARIARMKRTAVLVNVSRGGLIDEDALASALHEGRIFGAGIDVFEHEPPDMSHPLFSAPSAVLSDHAAWYSEASVRALQEGAAGEVDRVLSGDAPRNWVNPW